MKKQLFSLVMMLALIVIAGTSAWAQPSNGTAALPYWHVNGSTHILSVVAVGSNTYAWTTDALPADVTMGATNSNSLTITWSETAAGAFYFDVTETEPAPSTCAVTVRRVYVSVLAFDIYAYFSTNAGVDIEGTAPMADCGAGTTVTYGDIPGVAFSQTVNIEGSGTAGDLSTQTGTVPRTQRYMSLALAWATPPTGTFTPPAYASIRFDYTISLTDVGGTFVSFNGAAGVGGTTSVDGSGVLWTIPILYNAKWGVPDATMAVTITNATLFTNAGAGGPALGTERNNNETANGTASPAQNTTDIQTIYSAPATTVITVN